MASLERKVPITSSTVFPLASITKSFTAMSVLLAAERGLLSLDDQRSKDIPHPSIREHRVTIRHLLTHTSGLRDAYVLQGWAPNNGHSNDAFIKILVAPARPEFPALCRITTQQRRVLAARPNPGAGERSDTRGLRRCERVQAPRDDRGVFNGDPVRTARITPRVFPANERLASRAGRLRLRRERGNDGERADLLLWANNFAERGSARRRPSRACRRQAC